MKITLSDYEKDFLLFYQKKYDVAYIKVRNKEGIVPTEVILYSRNKKKYKHNPTIESVTVPNMFKDLKSNTFYEVNQLINERSE